MKRIIAALFSFIFLLAALVGLRRHLLARIIGISRPRYAVRIERGLHLPMRDGVTMATDHYAPSTAHTQPTILIRSPYGRHLRASPFGAYLQFVARLFAERGYHVLVQDTRGRFDSGGDYNPPFDETNDGLDTLAWLDKQPWHNGAVGLWGPSYLGVVQWALAPHAPQVKAMMPMVTCTRLQDILLPDGTFDLGLAMRWIAILEELEKHKARPYPHSLMLLTTIEKSLKPAFTHLPISNAEAVATGRSIPYYHTWMEHASPDDPFWHVLSGSITTAGVRAPVHFVGGWYDFFLRPLLKDYAALKAQGQQPHLTIGPYHHFNGMVTPLALRAGLAWFDRHLKNLTPNKRHSTTTRTALQKREDGGEVNGDDSPVNIYIMGADEWRAFPDYPPPSDTAELYLHPDRQLSAAPPMVEQSFDRYTYDPSDPTPILGGTQFSPRAGAKDNRPLMQRRDVLAYTSPVLTEPVEIIGAVRLQLYVASSLEYADFFGRLCDVHPNGKAINICEGLFRITPNNSVRAPDGSTCIEIDLWSTAYRFQPKHHIRLLLSSGAHPRWARNLGTGESLTDATTFKIAEQTIYHDRAHPSHLLLPVTTGRLP
ncbi:MAG: CocE/NonD family hydrolase [Chloroflexota bacterium]|nr:CocE/NonD family hydrolase [Chloroflexota bacterium]